MPVIPEKSAAPGWNADGIPRVARGAILQLALPRQLELRVGSRPPGATRAWSASSPASRQLKDDSNAASPSVALGKKITIASVFPL